MVLQKKYNLHPLENEYKKRGITLRDYQKEGVKKMLGWVENGHGGINADEMGLGKTCQTVVTLTTLFARGEGPFCVLAPPTVLSHWVKEIEFFSCGVLNPIQLHTRRDEFREQLSNLPKITKNTVVVGPSAVKKLMGPRHKDMPVQILRQYFKVEIPIIVVDEAHCIKSFSSTFRETLYKYPGTFILLTGTPIQNFISETFSLLQFVDKRKFDSMKIDDFVEAYSSKEGLAKLKKLLSNYMFRRLKETVCSLPESSEVIIYHGFAEVQKKLYVEFMTGVSTCVKISNPFMQIRKMVSHPYMFRGVEPEPFVEGEHLVTSCGKLSLLSDLCYYLKPRGHKVLIFCAFLNVLDIIEDFMALRGYSCMRLDGSCPLEKRSEIIDKYQKGDTFALVMTTETGGFGITLTAADTVIFYDTHFNPHVDIQAKARTHRIGQNKIVRVIRLLGSGTAEEYFYSIAHSKIGLHEGLTGENIEADCGFDCKAVDSFCNDMVLSGNVLNTSVKKMTEEELDKILGASDENGWLPYVHDTKYKAQLENHIKNQFTDYYVYQGTYYRKMREEGLKEKEKKEWTRNARCRERDPEACLSENFLADLALKRSEGFTD